MANVSSRLDRKLLGDTAWNYSAFALMAGTGVILNFFIAIQFGVETLGVFNQIYAVYVIAAQLAVFGLHDSAQKYTSEHHDQGDARQLIARSANLVALLIGAGVALIIYLSAPFIGRIANSASVGHGIAWAAPGLLFFALNKVQMGILNGERRMQAFAVMQGVRVLTILSVILVAEAQEWPGYMLGASFTVAELVIFGPLLILVRPWRGSSDAMGARDWRRRHLNFGAKALPNGFLAESYLRVDVLMLAIFVSDEAVGVYSFAAMFVEGLYQVPTVIRTVVNPVLVRLIDVGDRLALMQFGRRVMIMSLGVFVIAASLAYLIFPSLSPFFPDDLVSRAYPALSILIGGLVIYAAFVPLDFMLMQAGQPGWQSALMTLNITVNAALNITMIPSYGIHGAALATAAAFAVSAVTLNGAVWWRLGMRGGLIFAETRLAGTSTQQAGDRRRYLAQRQSATAKQNPPKR